MFVMAGSKVNQQATEAHAKLALMAHFRGDFKANKAARNGRKPRAG